MTYVHKPFYVIFFLLILSVSCSRNIDDDRSLSRKDYLDLGVPEYNKVWTQDDYMDAFVALNKLKLTNPSSLPRKNSRKSGALFERMINDENMSFLNTDTISLHEKAYQIQYFSSLQNELVRLYTNVLSRDQYYWKELIEIYIFGLKVTENKLGLADKIMQSEEIADKNMQYGHYSVQLGYLEMVMYILENHQLSGSYTRKDHENLSSAIVESVKRNKSWMQVKDSEKLKQKFQMVIDNTDSEIARGNYSELLENW